MGILRWITSIAGALLGGGILGGVIGYAAGSFLEKLISKEYQGVSKEAGDFSVSLLVLAASVMKADNRVMRSELNYVKDFLTRQMSEEMAQNRLEILRELLKRDIDLNEACHKIRSLMTYSSRLQLLHFLFGIANVDEACSQKERDTINEIAYLLGMSSADFKTIEAMYFKSKDSSYTILQVDRNATEKEIKNAYRKLAIKYHPDKVASLGQEAQKAANSKFQEINNAYEEIKKERNIA